VRVPISEVAVNAPRTSVGLGDLYPLPASVGLKPIAAMGGVWPGTDDVGDDDLVAFDAPA
jgi:hypothetical protein